VHRADGLATPAFQKGAIPQALAEEIALGSRGMLLDMLTIEPEQGNAQPLSQANYILLEEDGTAVDTALPTAEARDSFGGAQRLPLAIQLEVLTVQGA